MSRDVVIAGVGMIPFTKPGNGATYPKMASTAARTALSDAGVGYELIEQAYVGYVYADSTAGQRAIYEVGMTGIPIFNVNNNCSTGSTALYLARQAVANGAAECVLALGFEQMSPGAIGSVFKDRPTPFERFDQATDELVGHPEMPTRVTLLRRCGAGPYEGIRHEIVDLCENSRQGQPTCREQSHGIVQDRHHAGRGTGLARAMARCHDAFDGVSADLRCGGCRRVFCRICEAARFARQHPHQGPGNDHGSAP